MKSDINGNELTTITQSCSSSSMRTNILLKLKDEKTPVELGYIIDDLKLLIINRLRYKHSVGNCYAINHHVLVEGKLFEWIQLSDEYGVYKFTRAWALENGKIQDNGAMGFEVQTLLPILGIEQCKVNKPNKMGGKNEKTKINKKRTVIIDRSVSSLFDQEN